MNVAPPRLQLIFAALSLTGAVQCATAQVYMAPDETRLFSMEPRLSYIEAFAETQLETKRSRNVPDTSEQRLTDLIAAIGGEINGSIYHPSFLTFHVGAKEGVGREITDLEEAGATTLSESSDVSTSSRGLDAAITILSTKPYSAWASAYDSVERRNYDFFTRFRTQADGYMVGSGYQGGEVPFTVTFENREEEVLDALYGSGSRDRTLRLRAQHPRSSDSFSSLTADRNEFIRTYSPTKKTTGTSTTLAFNDVEYFGPARRKSLRSYLKYQNLSREASELDRIGVNEQFQVRHTPTLDSGYLYKFDMTDTTETESDSHELRATLNHKLYASLRSRLEVGGFVKNSGAGESSSEMTSYDAKLAETYDKNLGDWGHLKLIGSRTERRGKVDSSGSDTMIIDETAVLSDGGVSLLTSSGIDPASVVVSDTSGTRIYVNGVDYTLVPHGSTIEIRRTGGGMIPEGSTVLVDYSASQSPSDNFGVSSTYGGFYLDLFEKCLGLYGHVQSVNNTASATVNLDDLTEAAVGFNASAWNLAVGAELENHDSTSASYRATRAYERATFDVFTRSLLTIEFQQSTTKHGDSGEKRDVMSQIARFSSAPWESVSFRAEAGRRDETGTDTDAEQVFAGSGLSFMLGKFNISTDYTYSDYDQNGEIRTLHYAYVRARRIF